ncbi:hypothetical protein [Nocardia sp. NPDC051570]|uniref:hypothetical protein n=1 Tax=Nocardia sp. NPDC051570 TaxID=3364324 RepID=UPI0037B61980
MLSNIRRTVARVVVAGVLVAAPLGVLAVSAQAETVSTPITTEITHHSWNNPWDQPGLWDWNRHDQRGDCDPYDRRHHHPGRGWQRVVPPGWFGSS